MAANKFLATLVLGNTLFCDDNPYMESNVDKTWG